MDFFSRTKKLYTVLCILLAVTGISAVFQLFTSGIEDIFLNPENYILLFFTVGIFIVLVLLVIAIKCIICDAKEDFTAAFNLKTDNNKE